MPVNLVFYKKLYKHVVLNCLLFKWYNLLTNTLCSKIKHVRQIWAIFLVITILYVIDG